MKTYQHSLGNNALILSISKIITLFISLITGMLLSRFRTLEEYGTFSQIQMLVAFAVSLFVMGLPNSINYFYPRTKSLLQKEKFLTTYYSSCTLMSLLAGIVLFFLTPCFVFFFNNNKIDLFSYVFLLLPWTQILTSSLANTLIVSNKTRKLTLYNIIHSLFLLGLIFIMQVTNKTFESYIAFYCIVEVFFTIYVYYEVYLLINMKNIFFIDIDLLKDILIFSLPLGLAAVVGTINIEIGKVMIGYFLGTEMLAVYTNAGRELPLTIVSSSITAVLMPQLVRLIVQQRLRDAVVLWGNTVELSYIIMCFFSVCLFVFAPQVITFLYSEKYLVGVTPFRIYALVLIWRTTYFGMILNITGNSKLVFFSSIATLILNVFLVFICYHLWGFVGPSLAAFLSIGVMNLLQLAISSKITNISFFKLFPWKKLVQITILNICMGSIAFVVIELYGIENSRGDLAIACFAGILWMVLYYFLMKERIKNLWIYINKPESVC